MYPKRGERRRDISGVTAPGQLQVEIPVSGVPERRIDAADRQRGGATDDRCGNRDEVLDEQRLGQGGGAKIVGSGGKG